MTLQQRLKVSLIILISFTSNILFAQLGVKVSYIIPNHDRRQYYNNGIAPELFYINDKADALLRFRAGILYTNLAVRQDSFRIYTKQFLSDTLIPGYYIGHKFSMLYAYADISYPLINLANFTLYTGIGLDAGIVHAAYDRIFDSTHTGRADITSNMIGFRLTSSINYKINPHFDVYIEGTYNLLTTTKNSERDLSHSALSIGANYFIRFRKNK